MGVGSHLRGVACGLGLAAMAACRAGTDPATPPGLAGTGTGAVPVVELAPPAPPDVAASAAAEAAEQERDELEAPAPEVARSPDGAGVPASGGTFEVGIPSRVRLPGAAPAPGPTSLPAPVPPAGARPSPLASVPADKIALARASFERGTAAFAAGDFAAAAQLFRAAYAVAPVPKVLWNVVQAELRLGNRGAACRTYREWTQVATPAEVARQGRPTQCP
ncbi:MAG: hypothetical protein HY908_03915 [Myxococcales bacterium]|nr:hypothetical protein [Myxococcales bacterium]